MFSTIAHVVCRSCPVVHTARADVYLEIKNIKIAAGLLDLAGLITMVVLGVLAIKGLGGLPIGAMTGVVFVGGGVMGLMILVALMSLKSPQSKRPPYTR